MIMWIFLSILALVMLAVIYFDTARFIIPNWLVLALLALYIPWVMIAPAPIDWPMALAAFGACLAVGFTLFALNVAGAGDVKLLAVVGLYMGWTDMLPEFLFYMALLGGLLGVVVLTLRRIIKRPKGEKPHILGRKDPIPYGIAIAGAFLLLIALERLPGMAA